MRLCEKYWATQFKIYSKNKFNPDKVQEHFHLYSANVHHLLSNKNMYPKRYNQLIVNTDRDFKFLNGINEQKIFWRGVRKPVKGEQNYNIYESMYNKLLNLKEGDTLVMRHYAYASEAKTQAQNYLYSFEENKRDGILIKMTVPKGSKISRHWHEVVFPRYSKWICRQNIKEKDGNIFMNLEYIASENTTTEKQKFIKSCLNSIKDAFRFNLER